jgi:hypothetical protein
MSSAMDGAVLAQFAEITGSTPELAGQYLQLADFNIEQAMQLYFDNEGAPLTHEPTPSTSTPNRTSRPAYEDDSGIVHLDSDDDDARPAPRNPAFEDDAAMARRLQEEMYGGQDPADDVRAPMARTTETLVGPDAGFDGDMTESILSQIRGRQRRGGS